METHRFKNDTPTRRRLYTPESFTAQVYKDLGESKESAVNDYTVDITIVATRLCRCFRPVVMRQYRPWHRRRRQCCPTCTEDVKRCHCSVKRIEAETARMML